MHRLVRRRKSIDFVEEIDVRTSYDDNAGVAAVLYDVVAHSDVMSEFPITHSQRSSPFRRLNPLFYERGLKLDQTVDQQVWVSLRKHHLTVFRTHEALLGHVVEKILEL